MTASVVVIDDDRRVRTQVMRGLGATRTAVRGAASGAEARALLDDDADAVIVIAASRCTDDDVTLAATGGRTVILYDVSRAAALTLVARAEVAHLVGGDRPDLIDQLLVTVQKLVRRDLFGLEKYLAWSATIWERPLTSTGDRPGARAEIAATLTRLGAPARAVRNAVLIADELIANAIHNAPIDGDGVPYLREHRRDVERPLRARERPRLRWGGDGRRVAIEVTDRFGTLRAREVRHHVGKLRARDPEIRVDTAGAGLGLAMTYAASSQLVFNLDPGSLGQAIGVVELTRDDRAPAPVPSLHLFEVRRDD